MRCKEFEDRLQQVLDQRNLPETDGELCQLAQANEQLAVQLRAAEVLAAPPMVVMYPTANFADRIVAQIRAEDSAELKQRNTPAWHYKSFWLTGFGLAAAASIGMVLAISSFTQPIEVAAKPKPQPTPIEPAPTKPEPSKQLIAQNEFPKSLQDFSKRLDVREEKVEELRKVLKPIQSTLSVTIHVFRSTVPNRQQPPQHRPAEGQPSSSLFNNRWIA